jgi:hypothetical protein
MIISPASPLCWARGLTRHVNANQSRPSSWIWAVPSALPMVASRERPTTSTAPMAGATCWSRSSAAIGASIFGGSSGLTRRLPRPTSMSSSKPRAVDTTVLPQVRRQRCPSPTSRSRLHSRKFPTNFCPIRRHAALVADDAQGQADQDWWQDGAPRALRHVPDGGGRNPERAVRRYPARIERLRPKPAPA